VTDLSAVAKMVEQVEKELGAVDILVNNAGRLTSIAPVWEANPTNGGAMSKSTFEACSCAVTPS
jgi:NAD(P)-dependent dehydrogenase (short-subunit alcohol dehydrogenase family)